MPAIEQGEVISVRAGSVYELTRDIWDTNNIDKDKWDKLGEGWKVTWGDGFLMQNEAGMYRVTLVAADKLTVIKYGSDKNKKDGRVVVSTDPNKGVIDSFGEMTEKEVDTVLNSLCVAVRLLNQELAQAMAAN